MILRTVTARFLCFKTTAADLNLYSPPGVIDWRVQSGVGHDGAVSDTSSLTWL